MEADGYDLFTLDWLSSLNTELEITQETSESNDEPYVPAHAPMLINYPSKNNTSSPITRTVSSPSTSNRTTALPGKQLLSQSVIGVPAYDNDSFSNDKRSFSERLAQQVQAKKQAQAEQPELPNAAELALSFKRPEKRRAPKPI